MLKAIIFDVDGVLVDSKNANVDLFKRLLVKAGYAEPSIDEILKCFHLPLWQSLEKLTGSDDKNEIQRVFNIVKEPNFRAGTAKFWEFPLKLEEILAELHQKYKLAIVTSRIKIGMDDIFNHRKIQHLFDVVVTFEDYKNPKPHPEPLLIAVKKLNISPDETIYIGDSETDIEAAKKARMRSIHLSVKKHRDASAGITEFGELTSVIKSLL